jgi:hypothetical protein
LQYSPQKDFPSVLPGPEWAGFSSDIKKIYWNLANSHCYIKFWKNDAIFPLFLIFSEQYNKYYR